MSGSHGKFCWYELMTTDAAAAETFYRGVVGWGANDAGQPDMAYTLLLAGEAPVAGLMTLPEAACAGGAKPGWIGYVAVDDVDAYAARVTEAGGSVHRAPADIPGIGRFAVVADPQGATFVLFKGTAGMSPPPAGCNHPGYTGWHELMAADGEAAFKFYAGLFGWTKADAMDMGPMGIYQLFAAGGGLAIGGMMTKPPSVPAPFWTYYFQVDGIEAAVSRIKAGGGTIINGPMEVPGGRWIVQGLDPQGAMFALLGPKA
jgi:predicted enzyme related to lactoylglutathione lyase